MEPCPGLNARLDMESIEAIAKTMVWLDKGGKLGNLILNSETFPKNI